MTEKIHCALCGNISVDGIRVHGEVVCAACEKRLLKIEPEDEDYSQWVTALRKLWTKWSPEPAADRNAKAPEPE